MSLNNRALRIIVSLLTIPAILSITYYGGTLFLLFVLIIGVVSSYEFSKMVKKKGVYPNLFLTVLFSIVIILNFFYQYFDFYIIFLFIVPLIFLLELFRNKGSAISNTGAVLISLFYISLFAGSLIGIREFYNYNDFIYNQGGWLLIASFISIWICDSAAYFLGTAFGKHKLFPRVSPNKSWEGAAAGFVFAVITMLFLHYYILDFITRFDALVFGLIIGIMGQAGDLVESLLKRDAGVKDSSNIIPGHGGFFDRFDSLIFVAPFIYLYIIFLV